MDGLYLDLLVCTRLVCPRHSNPQSDRNYADFAIPGPFVTRVQNALKAEPTSVKLSGLVGAGGLWYGFGRMLLSLYVNWFQLHGRSGWITKIPRLDDEHGDLMSALLARVGGTASSNRRVASLTIVLLRPFGNGCSRWLIRRNILQL